MRANTGSGIDVSWGAIHRNGKGELISAQRKRGRWFLYFLGNWEDKRVTYCEKHRHNHLPQDFRAGKLTLPVLVYALKLKMRGEWSV